MHVFQGILMSVELSAGTNIAGVFIVRGFFTLNFRTEKITIGHEPFPFSIRRHGPTSAGHQSGRWNVYVLGVSPYSLSLVVQLSADEGSVRCRGSGLLGADAHADMAKSAASDFDASKSDWKCVWSDETYLFVS
jgi:hypothetical protein